MAITSQKQNARRELYGARRFPLNWKQQATHLDVCCIGEIIRDTRRRQAMDHTVFRDQVEEVVSKPSNLRLLTVGELNGDPAEIIMRNFVSSVVLEIADMEPKDWT